jgi:hypothetical protein
VALLLPPPLPAFVLSPPPQPVAKPAAASKQKTARVRRILEFSPSDF